MLRYPSYGPDPLPIRAISGLRPDCSVRHRGKLVEAMVLVGILARLGAFAGLLHWVGNDGFNGSRHPGREHRDPECRMREG